MADIIRDAALGQIIRWATNNRYLQYPEEKSDFKLPEPWLQLINNPDAPLPSSSSGSSSASSVLQEKTPEAPSSPSQSPPTTTEAGQSHSHPPRTDLEDMTQERLAEDEQHNLEKTKSIPVVPQRTKDGAILVDWYYTDDAENPYNWSNKKRALIAVIICLYTFVVYTTSAIYTTSEQGIMQRFGVGEIKATLGLSLYVLGYGVGPLIFSPLSEIPRIGRNPVYIITMFLFVIISIPTAFAPNYAGLMVLRFLQGFFAALGPLLSGFAVPAKSWRWSLFESVWASTPVFIAMFLLLPETSGANILLRRAQRLRRITGNQRFMSQSEIDQRNLKVSAVFLDALIKPIEITFKDPAVLFVQIYSAIIYGIYYSFFEVFPLVYPVYYGMNLGQIGLVFLCILVACLIGVVVFAAYLYFYLNPRIRRFGFPVQESRLIPALPASFGPTIGLFLFAWTARASIHWIVPTIGITIYGATVFIVMQCIFVYIPLSYPQYAASLFAANDFFRSALACGSVLFAHPLFANLGVAKGTSLLGGLSVIGIIGIWLLFFYGARLRALSKFAISE
ncbi:MFS-type transporter pyvG [Cladobotryum mycophilum]|uniref:MFS-type transporter pyvG n=1 Tax=Cladobotryum mycophilum TaxID=491253 RepID=A0ABR0T1E6_9HYPO